MRFQIENPMMYILHESVKMNSSLPLQRHGKIKQIHQHALASPYTLKSIPQITPYKYKPLGPNPNSGLAVSHSLIRDA